MKRPMPPELVALGDQLELAARRALGHRRTRRHMILNAMTSLAIAVPLVAGALQTVGTTAVAPVAAPHFFSPSLGAKADDSPPRLLSRVGHPSDDVLSEAGTLRRALR